MGLHETLAQNNKKKGGGVKKRKKRLQWPAQSGGMGIRGQAGLGDNAGYRREGRRGGPELRVTGTAAAQVSRGMNVGTLLSFLEI